MAQAGPNAGGTLILHAEQTLEYSDGMTYCGASLDSCHKAVTLVSTTKTTPTILYVMAAFDYDATPSLQAVRFGINLAPELVSLLGWGHCGDFATGENVMDGSGSPLSVFWNMAQTDHLVPILWMAAYSTYPGEESTIEIVHPLGGVAQFADDSIPPLEDEVAGFGVMGFGVCGGNECPLFNDNDVPPGEGTPTNVLIVQVPRSQILSDDTSWGVPPTPVAAATNLSSAVRTLLTASGAITVQKSFPTSSLADTIKILDLGDTIRVPTLADYFDLAYADAEAATDGLDALLGSTLLRGASQTSGTSVYSCGAEYDLPCVPSTFCEDDPLACCVESAETWSGLINPAWHLENCGTRANSLAGSDMRATDAPGFWPGSGATGSYLPLIGQVDTGLPAAHEDLRIHPLTAEERAILSQKDVNGNVLEFGFGGPFQHGITMSGLAAARADNGIGIKGVCSDCAVLDIHMRRSLDGSDVRWPARAGYALENFLDDNLAVFNTPFAWDMNDPDGYMTPAAVKLIWLAYIDGVPFVRPARNERQIVPQRQEPPFSVRVAGSTARDRFWGADPVDCDTNNQGCNPSEAGSQLGQVTICAPACGAATTTYFEEVLIPNRCGWGPYNTTCVETSGAVSMVGGLLALAKKYVAENGVSSQVPPDVLIALLRFSAREFAEDRAVMLAEYKQRADCADEDARCQEFTLDDFGPGIVDFSRFQTLCDLYMEEYGSNGLETHVVRYGDPGTTFQPLGPVLNDRRDDTVAYRVHALSATVQVPPLLVPGFPAAMAWAHPVRSPLPGDYPLTTTGLVYGSLTNDFVPPREPIRDHLVEICRDIPNCEWRWLDQNQGIGELIGYTIEVLDGSYEHVGWVREPESLVMSMSALSARQATDVGEGQADAAELQLVVSGRQPAATATLCWKVPLAASWTLRIVDASGRSVTERAGRAVRMNDWSTWRPDLGRGVYWAVLRGAGTERVRKLVVIN